MFRPLEIKVIGGGGGLVLRLKFFQESENSNFYRFQVNFETFFTINVLLTTNLLKLLPMIGVIYISNNLVHKIMTLYHFWGHNDLSKAENRKKRNTKIAVSQPFFELQHSNFAQTLLFIPTLILHSKIIKIRKKFSTIFRRQKTYHFWWATRPPPIVV